MTCGVLVFCVHGHSGGLMCQKDEEFRRDLSELLALLVFDEMAAVQEWYFCAFCLLECRVLRFWVSA